MNPTEAIERVERMLVEASPGPWRLVEPDEWNPQSGLVGPDALLDPMRHDDPQAGKDARLIAQSRTLLPALLEVVRAAQAVQDWYDEGDGNPPLEEALADLLDTRLRAALHRFSQEVGR